MMVEMTRKIIGKAEIRGAMGSELLNPETASCKGENKKTV